MGKHLARMQKTRAQSAWVTFSCAQLNASAIGTTSWYFGNPICVWKLEVAERSEAELEPEQVSFIEGCPAAWAGLPIPNGPLTIGIDGGFVRDQRDKGWFEVIAGKKCLGVPAR